MTTEALLPSAWAVALEYVAETAETIDLIVIATQPHATCPDCGHSAQRCHSRYTRTLADLPWQGIPVRLLLRTRRFFCDRRECPRTIFTERLPALVRPYGRRTLRLAEAFHRLAAALGGEAGARMAASLGMRASPETLRRRLQRQAPEAVPTPRLHRPPRARAARPAARAGAREPPFALPAAIADGSGPGGPPIHGGGGRAAGEKAWRGERRHKRYAEVVERHQRGESQRQIAAATGLSRATVARYLTAGEFPEIARRVTAAPIAPYLPALRQRWAAGGRNGRRLWEEIVAQGVPGPPAAVYRAIAPWRAPLPPRGRRPRRPPPGGAPPGAPPPPPRAAARRLIGGEQPRT